MLRFPVRRLVVDARGKQAEVSVAAQRRLHITDSLHCAAARLPMAQSAARLRLVTRVVRARLAD
jgi:hypothetical protein